MPKRALSSGIEDDSSDLTDIEDMLSPPSSANLARTLSGFAFASTSQRATRSQAKRLKMETQSETVAHAESTPSTSIIKPIEKQKSATTSQRKQKPIQMELDVPHIAPAHWREVYGLIEDMKKDIIAPVDTMGCASAMKNESDPKIRRYGTLVSLMLSSQTKDEVTTDALRKLESALGELTIENVIQADDEVIQAAIGKVGFWRRKTGYIKQAAQMLKDNFDSDVPKTVDELCSLPGVGPKMAFLALQVAWNINLGIGVDVHVHRITNRLGWHKPPTTTPEQTRLNLQSWLPKELHPEINPLLVGFGQVICLPVGPKCGSCTLSERGLCPSAVKKKTSPIKPQNLKRTVTDLMKEEDLIKIESEDDRPEAGPSDSKGIFPKLESA